MMRRFKKLFSVFAVVLSICLCGFGISVDCQSAKDTLLLVKNPDETIHVSLQQDTQCTLQISHEKNAISPAHLEISADSIESGFLEWTLNGNSIVVRNGNHVLLDASFDALALTKTISSSESTRNKLVASDVKFKAIVDFRNKGGNEIEWNGADLESDLHYMTNSFVQNKFSVRHNKGNVYADFGLGSEINNITVTYCRSSFVPRFVEKDVLSPLYATGDYDNPHDSFLKFVRGLRPQDRIYIRHSFCVDDDFRIPEADENNRTEVKLSIPTPGSAMYLAQETNTTYVIVECGAEASFSFDSNSSSASGDYAKNAWVHVKLSNSSIPCYVFINSFSGANGAAGMIFPPNSLISPSMKLERFVKPDNSGYMQSAKIELHYVSVRHLLLVLPERQNVLEDDGVVRVTSLPVNSDFFVYASNSHYTIEFNEVSSNQNIVVLDSDVYLQSWSVNADSAFILAGNNHLSKVTLEASAFESIRLVAGCVSLTGNERNYKLSDWLYDMAVEYGVDSLPKSSFCDMEIFNASFLGISGLSALEAGALYSDYVNILELSDDSSLSVSLEVPLNERDRIKKYIPWKEINIVGEGALQAVLENGDNFIVNHAGGKNFSFSLHSPVLAKDSVANVKCTSHQMKTTDYNFYFHPQNSSSYDSCPVHIVNYVEGPNCRVALNNYACVDPHWGFPFLNIADGHTIRTKISFDNKENSTDQLDLIPNSLRKFVEDGDDLGDNRKNRTVTLSPLDSPNITEGARVLLTITETNNDVVKTVINASFQENVVNRVFLEVSDDSQNYILPGLFDPKVQDATKGTILNINATDNAFFFFPDLGTGTILFKNARAVNFKPDNRSFSIEEGGSGYCFDPCTGCSNQLWERTHVFSQLCPTAPKTRDCKSSVAITMQTKSNHMLISCGAPEWGNVTNSNMISNIMTVDKDKCPLTLNHESAADPVPKLKDWVLKLAFSLIIISGVSTLLCLSMHISRLTMISKRRLDINRWYARNLSRDVFVDAFSWSALVFTACMSDVGNFDYTEWGVEIVSVLLQAKHVILMWFGRCDANGTPEWDGFKLFALWAAAFVVLVTRLGLLYATRKRKTVRSKREKMKILILKDVLFVILSLFFNATSMFLPYVAYTSTFIKEKSFRGIFSVIAICVGFVCAPIERTNRRTIPVATISTLVINILVQAVICAVIGRSAPLKLVGSLCICGVIITAISSAVSLWFSFFSAPLIRTTSWKVLWILVLLFRFLGMTSGIVFISFLLRGRQLSNVEANALLGLWCAWIVLPWISTALVAAATPTVLSERSQKSDSDRDTSLSSEQEVEDDLDRPLLHESEIEREAIQSAIEQEENGEVEVFGAERVLRSINGETPVPDDN